MGIPNKLERKLLFKRASCNHRRKNRGHRGLVPPTFLQIIRQSAPLQLKELPIFSFEGATEYMCPYF